MIHSVLQVDETVDIFYAQIYPHNNHFIHSFIDIYTHSPHATPYITC